jgi:hypothetical protein
LLGDGCEDADDGFFEDARAIAEVGAGGHKVVQTGAVFNENIPSGIYGDAVRGILWPLRAIG